MADGENPGDRPDAAHLPSSEDPSAESSAAHSQSTSRPTSAHGEERSREKHRVRFTSGTYGEDEPKSRARSRPSFFLGDDQPLDQDNGSLSPPLKRVSPAHSRPSSVAPVVRKAAQSPPMGTLTEKESPPQVLKPRPLLRRNNSTDPSFSEPAEIEEKDVGKFRATLMASQKALKEGQRVSRSVGTTSAPVSVRSTPTMLAVPDSPPPGAPDGMSIRTEDIPMVDMDGNRDRREYDSDSDVGSPELSRLEKITSKGLRSLRRSNSPHRSNRKKNPSSIEANRLVQLYTQRDSNHADYDTGGLRSGHVTPEYERRQNWVAPPQEYRGGILASLLKLRSNEGASPERNPFFGAHQRSDSMGEFGTQGGSPGTPGSSGFDTPRTREKWYNQKKGISSSSRVASSSSLAGLLINSSSMLATPAVGQGVQVDHDKRPSAKQKRHSAIGSALNRISRPRLEDEIRITVHIAETLARQRYLVKLCRALMQYGAPTHRLEEYMKMSARVLEIDGQFLYIPGCMIISFDDSTTHTTEVKLIRAAQGVDLGKLYDTHRIYKEVVHDMIGVEEATQRLQAVIDAKPKYPAWQLVFVYGLASATVGPFAFGARLIDLPIAFILGCLLGVLQLIAAPRSELYANVLEISAAVFTSFLARAFGSIKNGELFCFSALAQSSIALILPGYTVLCGSLELQSKSIVAGSVRMVYAVIYSLFIGFGITIGTAFYGLADRNATSATTCSSQMPKYVPFAFVPAFTLCLIVINQAKWKQAPVMLVIAFAGYLVNFFSATKFPQNAQISNTLGAFAVGILGNVYSRVGHGLAAAALLPAIFVQVPSGLSASGSLVSGIASADRITGNSSTGGATTVQNVTSTGSQLDGIVFNVGYSMIQVAIGITVGLFLSALVVYPMGKKRSALFSF